ncbi:MAG TPA: bifunctional DNA-formamidopyrimidine glycosylase/DNA-(apurinic or apyrimidinic site) lyase [Ideonella sp.]|uniref:bifunctional DNA-formamidopyrimidine glycosylase/DNA-(apurinic or apyrimidinic site) lyase n=1 Tax=Ideonella sp. TaxID=1929293 RepID=UPI002E3081A4|nr:bifunctional DNA-formamidopyrimidine glycosylase/DNA-(apurinic or apyrimidinic site) lyase [Ideonella sp.]HEX5684997.1 bifunctional DNA-formamidopyrimidine glycosylase/DNA-(apurinic or apyrimidinic site) lyase [Ideonella sp.]
MPELPEVEVTRRSVGGIEGARILALRMGKPLRWPLGVEPEELVGLRVGAVGRRGKYLWLPLLHEASTSGAAGGLLWHLGMSGSLAFGASLGPSGKHDHAELVTDQGLLRLTDPRRFGAVVWSDGLDVAPAATLLARLGPEPFDPAWTAEALHVSLQGRRTAVKLALLSGELVVGAGNIYASDALWQAGIDPRTPCTRIGPARAAKLHAAVQQVLAEAIAAGGSTLRDFRNAHGEVGQYQGQARVYGRGGETCARCGGTIRRIVQGQRATYFCPGCQRR